ncbi:MAG TPA: hypothetical protein VNQ76_20270 [Planctomicrobium sp.]|nr:hypothetical protein [Planctomicrobium sp.]
MNKRRFLIPALLALIASALVASSQVKTYSDDAVTQPENRFGLVEYERDDVAYMSVPPLQLDGMPAGASSAGSRVFLWDIVKQVNGGENLPTLRQETGDCTAFATTGGIHYLQAIDIAEGSRNEFQEIHPSFIYGVSRTAPDIGNKRLGRSSGAVGQWSVEAPKVYGALPKSAPGVPPYSGRLSDQWGYSGVPKALFEFAEKYKIGSYARCPNYESIRDAIASKYPVVIASNQGFRMQPSEHASRMFGTAAGSWAHQMVFIGVDDTVRCPDGSTGALYLLNSWGSGAHGEPLNGEPLGGFWVSRRVADRMSGSGEAYALSNFSGFPYRPANIRIFGSSSEPQKLIACSSPPPGVKYLSEYVGIERRHTSYAALGVLISAVLCAIPRPRRKSGISRNMTA